MKDIEYSTNSEKSCENCVSFDPIKNRCDSVDTNITKVFKHNFCRCFISKKIFVDFGKGNSVGVECTYCKDEGWIITNRGLTSSPCPMNCKINK